MNNDIMFLRNRSFWSKRIGSYYASLLIIFVWSILFASCGEDNKPAEPQEKKSAEQIQNEKDSAFIAAASTDEADSNEAIRVSYPVNTKIPYEEDGEAGKSTKRVYTGRRLNIAITGVDGRLGTATKHADANHVVSILLDSGKIEITSIPRDTPADAGYEDGHAQNKLTICRAARGRQAYFKELARIARLDQIHYFVEVGFSQVMGILDFLGYDDPASTLQVLRSRKALGGDDYQRVYSQGQFIRQMLIRHFGSFTGTTGDVLLRGGLLFVDTDIDIETAKKFVAVLEKQGFPKNSSDVTVRVRPPIPRKYKNYDFTDFGIVDGLKLKIEDINKHHKGYNTVHPVDPQKKLEKVIASAISDSSKSAIGVINKLKNYYSQRAWHQVKDKAARFRMRDQIGALLYNAYMKKSQPEEANKVKAVIDAEKKLFSVQLKKK